VEQYSYLTWSYPCYSSRKIHRNLIIWGKTIDGNVLIRFQW